VHLLPLRREVVEMELNNLFADAFEACASSAGEAYAALDPLLKACVDKMKAAACTLPPRRDLFVAYADGVHHRMINIFQVLLVRYDLDRAYLDTDGQETKEAQGHHEALEPALMLGLIGWARRYEERMEAVGAGAGRKLLAPEASEALISAYLHACRVLTKQWATNIVFVELEASSRFTTPAALLEAVATDVRATSMGPRTVRLVTHLDVNDADVDRALAAFTRATS
jgi:hypothetical protein